MLHRFPMKSDAEPRRKVLQFAESSRLDPTKESQIASSHDCSHQFSCQVRCNSSVWDTFLSKNRAKRPKNLVKLAKSVAASLLLRPAPDNISPTTCNHSVSNTCFKQTFEPALFVRRVFQISVKRGKFNRDCSELTGLADFLSAILHAMRTLSDPALDCQIDRFAGLDNAETRTGPSVNHPCHEAWLMIEARFLHVGETVSGPDVTIACRIVSPGNGDGSG